ncbi:MAG: Fic family protein [Chloroflexota bacterium]|nr:Fic family protein [Chloroflexota bacterium]MDE2896261.1 Fic family protein [Chloroflexota bacterium]
MNQTAPPVAFEWDLIDDLPPNWDTLCRVDLHAVHRQWIEDRSLIKDQEKLRRFQEQLALQWAVETGIIERLYKVDRGVTVQILQAGMEALGQFHARGLLTANAQALIKDQREALEMVMDLVGGERTLNDAYMKELHHRLTLSQETTDALDPSGKEIQVQLMKGVWKRNPNNPLRPDGSIHQYCPPEFVQDEIDQLLKWHSEHESLGVCPEVEAAWLHHRFTQIHPFQDGNGRVARALTTAIFVKADYLVLVIRDEEHRERYINALEAADYGDLKPLVDLFAEVQISDLDGAISALRELRGETLVRVSETIAERAKRRMEVSQRQAAGVMEDLQQVADARLQEAAAEIQRAFQRLGVTVQAEVLGDEDDKRDWWSWQIIDSARRHNYFAELDRPRRWVSLKLALPDIEKRQARLVVSFHAVGRSADLHAVTAFLTNPLEGGEDDESRRWETKTIPEYAFKFGAETSRLDQIEPAFRDWLDETVESGLSVWGERL